MDTYHLKIKIAELTAWFIDEWAITFLFGALFAVVFWDMSLMGWFVAGAILRNYFQK